MSQKRVVKVCSIVPGASLKQLGCSEFHPFENRCIIVMIDKPSLGVSPEAVLRHEIGHCNGWPSNHPD